MLTHSVKTIKLFRRAFLKPITSRPTQGTCDLTSLFDLEGLYVEDTLILPMAKLLNRNLC